MHPNLRFRSVGLTATVLTAGALTALVGGPLGLVRAPTASAQVPYMMPMPIVMPMGSMMGPEAMGPMMGMPVMSSSPGTMNVDSPVSLDPGADYAVSGEYCKDQSGGDIYIPSGAPVEEGVNCSSSSGMGGAMDTNGMPDTSDTSMPTTSSSTPASSSGSGSPATPGGGSSGGY